MTTTTLGLKKESLLLKENDVGAAVQDWIEQKKLREIDYFTATILFDYEPGYRPDIFVRPKYAKKEVVAIEVKGDKLDTCKLLGQLLIYALYYPRVYAAIPESKVSIIKKIRTKIRRKLKGFDFKILSVSDKGKIRVL